MPPPQLRPSNFAPISFVVPPAMLSALLLGFFFGAVAVVAVEAAVLLAVIHRLSRGRKAPEPAEPQEEGRHLDPGQPLASAGNKQGTVWVLESEKIPKVSTHESPTRAPKEQKNKDIVEVIPVKKYAKIKGHSLILSDLEGSQATIDLLNCTIVAVSASNQSSRKWAKRYPIRLESKNSLVYNGSKTCFLYLDTSWEKESWCRALCLASCLDKEKLKWYAQLSEEFHHYLTSLNAEYPSFLKPSSLGAEAIDQSNRIDVSTSKVRSFLKKFTKKASKSGVESKTSSTTSSTRGERKIGDKLSSHDESLTDGLIKGYSEGRSSSSSLQDLVQPTSPTSSHLGNKSLHAVFPDAVCNEKFVNDEGTLCLNLLFSRLFFDAKRSNEMKDAIKTRIQRTLSSMRTPSYIGGVVCAGLDLGNLPPYIHKLRLLPMDLNEVWAVEVDIEYSGGILLDVETRLEVCEPGLQEDIINTSFEPSSAGEVTSDLLESIEHYGNQLKSSSDSANRIENRDEGDKVDGLRQSKSSSWASSYVSRWKAIKQSFSEQVSQVPLSLAIRVLSLRGTLRLHIKPPPSDQLWFGFTSVPEIDLNLESSVGDRKIASTHIALLISNRFKAAIRETLVLPNLENLCIPWMLAEKDDWVPRTAAPFIRASREAVEAAGIGTSNSHLGCPKLKPDGSNDGKSGPAAHLDDNEEKTKDVMHVQQQLQEEPLPAIAASQRGQATSISSTRSLPNSSTSDDLRLPPLRADEAQESSSDGGVESPRTSTSGAMVTLEAQAAIPSDEDAKSKKTGRRARMLDLGRRVGERLEEKRRQMEEKSRLIVEKMRENSKN